MRLGILTTSYPREDGDPAGAFVGAMARWLAGRGHEVDVVAAGPGAARDGPVTIQRVHAGAGLFYGEGAPDRLERRPLGALRAPLFAAALAGRAVLAARRRRWDAVISHWLLPCGVVGARLGRPHLAIAHSGDVHLAVRAHLAAPVAAALTAPGTRTVFVAEHLKRRFLAALAGGQRGARLRDHIASRALVCPMGVVPPRPADRTAARRRFGLDPRRPVVAFLGRLVPIKGADVLVRAVAGVPGAQLVVGGDGPLRSSLEALARANGRIVFPGELRGAARDDLFAAADLMVLPSIDLPGGRTEGAPTVALEALAAGVPLLASATPWARDLLQDCAQFFRAGDPHALAASIASSLASPPAPGPAARALAERHSWDRIGERLLASVTP
jgi:glycosyltransferase involved in cell wall biosynthesis